MSSVLEAAVSTAAGIGRLDLEHGGHFEDARIAFSLHGHADLPAVLVLGGISSGRHILAADGVHAGWWPGVVGAGNTLDPARHRLIGVDYLAGRGDSSSPAPEAGCPVITTADQAAAIVALLDCLGIGRLHAVVGASYGGMVALALAERFGTRLDRVVAICAAHRAHPMATAIRSIQRRVIRLAAAANNAAGGVAVARALAMTTYRTAAEFEDRFGGAPLIADDGVQFPVDSYLDHHARDYAATFPAECFLALSQSLDLHHVDPSRISAECALICFDSDTLVPPAEVHALARALPREPAFTCIRSRYGHDGFLKEPCAVSDALAAALNSTHGRHTIAAPITHYAARSSATTSASGTGSSGNTDTNVRRSAAAAPATAAVRAGIASDTQHGAVIPPIHLSTTYTFEDFGKKRPYDYSRSGNPTRDLLAAAIADLEQGAAGLVTPTGMAAIAVTLQLLRPQDLLLAAHDGYGGTYRLMQALARRQAFHVEFVDFTRSDAAAIVAARRPRMIWLESPSNPLLRITDIAALSAAARAAGAITVVDNTFLSPALQTPIEFGADIVVHSTTKYLNGHSDVVGGAIVARDVALAEELGWWANCTGAAGSPFDSYLTLRGLRTLHPRMRSHQENAAAIVDLLHGHPAVRALHYPGIPSHPGHNTAVRQQRGFGAMLSFELDGNEHALRRFLSRLEHFSLAESLGGVESLIAHPATMTHAAMDAPARANAGISDELLRLSVGIEDPGDLTRDIARALDSISSLLA